MLTWAPQPANRQNSVFTTAFGLKPEGKNINSGPKETKFSAQMKLVCPRGRGTEGREKETMTEDKG